MSVFTTGPNSPFFVFNVYVLSAAAYRWGFLETLATAGAAIVLYFSQAFLAPPQFGSGPFYSAGEFELNRFIMRGIYLLIMSYLVGYLGEEEKFLRSEASSTARIVGRIQSEVGVRATLQAVLDEVCRLFGARQSLILFNETSTGRAFLWEAKRVSEDEAISVSWRELDPGQRAAYIFDQPDQAWHARLPGRRAREPAFEVVAVDESGKRRSKVSWSPPEAFLKAHGFRGLLGVQFAFGNAWSGYLALLDPSFTTSRQAGVDFLLALSRNLGPAIYNVYLTGRLRSRAGAVERARVARELHDGVIQSLIGLEMQVDVLRREERAPPARLSVELGRIQTLLRQEVLNLRELMQQMNPLDLSARQLLDFLAYTVDKFRRETGIAASFSSGLEEVRLPPRVCNELARILQEALVNVRKHSGAENVRVQFDSQDGLWKLSVDDDGRGFDFSGRLTQAELDSARRGPMVIKERVRSMGGELAIDSHPGRGARLEITFSQKAHG